MSDDSEARYRATVAELQHLAAKAPYVTQEWILTVASMDPAEMRRRLIRNYDWHCHFNRSLDGIPEINALPGAGIDGCRSHKEVRAVVMGLLRQIRWLKAEVAKHVFQRDKLLEALKKVVKANGGSDCYADKDDEIGRHACCGELSYEPHDPDCYVSAARDVVAEVEGE